MDEFEPTRSIIPLVKASKHQPIQEILGTGSFIGKDKEVYILTAKHIFEGVELNKDDKFAFVLNDGKGIGIWAIRQIVCDPDYDIAVCYIDYVDGMVPLQFSEEIPSLTKDIFCFEYSRTSVEAKPEGGKHVSFEPLSHKGNIMRSFNSTFPEKKVTPAFNTSFPALQGASGAPVLAGTKNKNFYIAGILVANQETHLLPAQLVQIVDGEDYIEETSYFLPMGKAISSTLLTKLIQGLGIKIEFVE